MIHCHRAQHMMMGKLSLHRPAAILLIVSPEGMQIVWAIGTADQICAIPREESQGYLFYGGDVYGNETHTPTYHHYFTPSNQLPLGKMKEPIR